MNLPSNFQELSGQEQLIFCKSPTVTSDQIAVLIVKPSNNTPNANNSLQNIKSIIGRVEAKGWYVHSLKIVSGSAVDVEKVATHYPQPFSHSLEDVRPHLSSDERQKLAEVWGDEALSYALYHPVHLSNRGIMDFETSAKVWHVGRGPDNTLIDVGHVEAINTITENKDPVYGKRRLLLVRSHDKPFFMINGFAAELVNKFLRPAERIVVMVIAQKYPKHSLSYLREHVAGATSPYEAKPGSIRYDALHQATYSGTFPIVSKDEVGIENNIIHLSDSLAEANRELAIWMPELLWQPNQGGIL